MAKNKLTAQYKGQTFTRTTDRVYTHIVVARYSHEHAVSQIAAYAADQIKTNFAYYLKVAAGTSGHTQSESQVQRAKEYVEGGLEASIARLAAKMTAEIADRKAKGFYDKWNVIGWCGRPDLATKLLAQTSAPYYAEVHIVPVDA